MKHFRTTIFKLSRVITPLVIFVAAAFGQSPAAKPAAGYPFLKNRWTTEQGLPQNTITSIIQTADGYLWLGTFGGLVRFDGVRFTVYNTANSPALISNRILSLYEDSDRVIWIGTDAGDIVCLHQGVFRVFAVGDDKPNNFTSALLVDSRGDLWVGRRNGLSRYEKKDAARMSFFPVEKGVGSIAETAAGEIWLTTEDGIAKFANGDLTRFRISDKAETDSTIKLEIDQAGNIWTMSSSGIGRFRDGKFQADQPRPTDVPRYLIGLRLDREQRAWYGMFRYLYQLSADGSHRVFDIGDVTTNAIRTLFFDREDNLWVGTNGDGLIRLRRKQVETLSANEGLPNDETTVIIEDPKGGEWIGSYQLIYRNGPTFRTYGPKDGLPHERITALHFDPDGTLWVGTFRGLASIKDGRVTPFTDNDPERLPVKSILRDSRGRLWLGRMGGGLQIFENGKFTTYRKENGLVNNDVRYLMEDRSGDLWIGTVGGLSRFRDGSFTSFTNENGLSNNFVRAIEEDPAGGLWIGTYGGGLNRFRDGKFTPVTIKHGLFDDFVSRILTDDSGTFWILGNRGVFSVSRESLNAFADGKTNGVFSTSYGVADGMLSSEGNGGNQPAGWRMRDGRLWFPTIRGVAIFTPTEVSKIIPPVYIEEARLNGRLVDFSKVIGVQPDEENLEIQYTGLNFGKPEQVRFRYKLEGLDSAWTEAGTRRVAYFPHLPPGSYRFLVMAANSDAEWSEPAVLEIKVFAPFWRRWWFIGLVVLSVVGLTAISYQLRLNQLERRRAAQEELSRRLINAHETERHRIAAELHDGLGQSLLVIKNRSLLGEMASPPATESTEQFRHISEAANQAIEEVRQITYNLRPHHLERLGLTEALEAMIENVADSTTIDFEAHISLLDDAFSKENEVIFYRIVQECVSNIVRHSQATSATVEVLRGERDVTMRVSDNGIGFVKEAETAAAMQRVGGFGLFGMTERVRMLGGTYSIESSPRDGTTISVKVELT